MNPIVLYPSPGMGYLVSMVELSKLLVNRNHAVTIIIIDPPYNTGSTAPFIARVSASNPSITFHRLPAISLPSNPSSANHKLALTFQLISLSNPDLKNYLLKSPPRALVVDFFCACVLDVARELSLPCYYFYTSGAGALACFLNFPILDSRISLASFKELGSAEFDIPGVPPMPANHMPLPVMDNSDYAYRVFLDFARSFLKYEGILINTFHRLESRAIKAILNGECCAGATPPVYCIGPLITSEGRAQSGQLQSISWLDTQPEGSVVFLCFGSLGSFSAEQIKEIAIGLERSTQRFLWVVRSPPNDDPTKKFAVLPEPDLDVLLPEGFLERTGDRGLVVKSWAPQVEVLKHRATGAFVTHCGWNSALEAICNGVPMIAWPLYAEQRWNKVFLVEEMKLAVGMKGYESGLVKAEEVETRVKWLMETVGGKELKERVMAAKEEATVAVGEGGTSYDDLGRLMEAWRKDATRVI